ncbi:MAG: single-stranded DNA-binding protein [Clostridia bacterium]|nr:single-stranded DNA-binding protein [Clostridia bacterium]
MNKAFLIGRLTADPELSNTSNGTPVCRFRLAVNRAYKTADGIDADYINIIVWRGQAQSCSTYLKKGSQCCVVGSIQTRTYEKEGQTRYVTEINAENVEFLGRPSGNGSAPSGGIDTLDPIDDDSQLPF